MSDAEPYYIGARRVAVIDAETDPFKHGRVPAPFAWGFYDGETYRDWWKTKTCDPTAVMIDFLDAYPEPLIIYAHNGGKFDFMFFIEKLNGKIRIVNGRILEAHIGKHIIRDSYAILPISLKKLGAGKKEIDYKLMEADVRDQFKGEILEYLEADCFSLHSVVVAFLEKFGDVLTVGSAAMREFKRYHKFETVSSAFDKFHRNYYFGGRCQCFETGVIDTKIEVFDLNSAYPDAMDKLWHPIGRASDIGEKIEENTMFVCWEGENFNAVPTRTKTGLDFNVPRGTFWTTIHEFNAALDLKVIKPHRIKHTVSFEKRMVFSDFVQYFYESRNLAKKHGDKFLEIFYKLILNSAYGKFAQDSSNFVDSIILPWGDVPPSEYYLEYRHDRYAIWSKPATTSSYYNVATAASITGGVRATLLRGLAASTRPLYCDTDSIFCESFNGETDEERLGAWKHEATGNQIAIGGKKLYALMDGDKCIKKASKGANLHPLAIFSIARGDTIEDRQDAPTFKIGGKVTTDESGGVVRTGKAEHQFIKRSIRRTSNIGVIV